jgi:hypothetical protein
MISIDTIAEIFSLYKKHGWKLRRVLLSPALEKILGSPQNKLLDGVERRSSDIDAAWFSRSSPGGRETWELRLLGPTPFALLAVLDEKLSEIEREEALRRIEAKMRDFKSRAAKGH